MREIWAIVREMTQPTRRRSKLSVSQIADGLRVPVSTLYQYGEPDKMRFPADLIAPLTEATGDTLLIESLAIDCNGVFSLLPSCKKSSEQIGKSIAEFGEFIQEFGTALADNTITEDELERIKREGNEAIREIQQAIQWAENKAALVAQTPRKPHLVGM